MSKNENIAKMALAAIVIASAMPMDASALNQVDVRVAVPGCAAHGCGGKKPAESTDSTQKPADPAASAKEVAAASGKASDKAAAKASDKAE